MFGIEPGRAHWRLEIERQPLLHALHVGSLGEVEEQSEIQNDRRREDRIAAEKIDLDLHLVAEPAKNVDVVPTFFVIATRRIVIDLHNV